MQITVPHAVAGIILLALLMLLLLGHGFRGIRASVEV